MNYYAADVVITDIYNLKLKSMLDGNCIGWTDADAFSTTIAIISVHQNMGDTTHHLLKVNSLDFAGFSAGMADNTPF